MLDHPFEILGLEVGNPDMADNPLFAQLTECGERLIANKAEVRELDIVDIDEINMVNIQAVHTLIHAFDSAFCRVVPNVHAVLAIAADFR